MPKTKEEISQLKTEYETLTAKLKELNVEELKQVIGGDDGPEEFDWRGKSYSTPIKDDPAGGSSWKFSAIGNTDGQYFKIITESLERINQSKNKK